MTAETKQQQRTAVQEARVLGAVQAIPGIHASTLTGSVQAHTIRNEQGDEIVRVMRIQCWDITPQQWEEIGRKLVL